MKCFLTVSSFDLRLLHAVYEGRSLGIGTQPWRMGGGESFALCDPQWKNEQLTLNLLIQQHEIGTHPL